MAMEHKAYVLDYDAFTAELVSVLNAALTSGDPAGLVAFINEHRNALKDPYEGEPLDEGWENMVSPADAHQYGDIALTLYYDPSADIGLGYDWENMQSLLEREGLGQRSIALGRSFGPSNNLFDPGKMGSYVQPADRVRENLAVLDDLVGRKPDLTMPLQRAMTMLRRAADDNKGLYVTF